mmetsp:Transcript_3516/g.5398  ORF Transcript_3516/g.5398 Transcript_3516/m.5398 type:complete len:206 (+) Transcript_3516:3467-4084(+)
MPDVRTPEVALASGLPRGPDPERASGVEDPVPDEDDACATMLLFILKSGFFSFEGGILDERSTVRRGMSSSFTFRFLQRTSTSNLMFILRSSTAYRALKTLKSPITQGFGGRKTIEFFAPSKIFATKGVTAISLPFSYPWKRSSLQSSIICSTGRFRAKVICPNQLPRFFSRLRSDVDVVIFGERRSLPTFKYTLARIDSTSPFP